MTASTLDACYVRARRAVPVTVDRACDGDATPRLRFRGRLLSAMYAQGELHHYRIEDGNGDLFLCPPAWIMGEPPMLVSAASAEGVA